MDSYKQTIIEFMTSNFDKEVEVLISDNESEIYFMLDKIDSKLNLPSLNLKVENAKELSSQGDFNKAMLNISESNRDQVISIRKIQKVIDEINKKGSVEVVFKKYRQFFPLEIGIENGNEVLKIINEDFKNLNSKFEKLKLKLHQLEVEDQNEKEKLDIYKRNFPQRIREEEEKEVESKLTLIKEKVKNIKLIIIQQILLITEKKFSNHNFKTKINGFKLFLELFWNLFFIFMSPILIKEASLVRTEK